MTATDTRTHYQAKYVGADANKVAHYPGAPGLRWVNTKGDKGPWSETASATIGAQRDRWAMPTRRPSAGHPPPG